MSKNREEPKNYAKPPIIEAVIEVRFSDAANQEQLEKLLAKKKSNYTVQPQQDVSIKIYNDNSAISTSTEKRAIWYKLIDNEDISNIVQIKNDALSVSRLPLYEGWETLLEKFKNSSDWYTHKKFKSLSRIGVRYINRIDIPTTNGRLELSDYFNIYPNAPKENFPDLNHFLMQTISKLDSDRVLTINMRSVESILLNHTSFIFDLDISQTSNLPVSSAKLYETLDLIRGQKDKFFEDLLTEKCKELFN